MAIILKKKMAGQYEVDNILKSIFMRQNSILVEIYRSLLLKISFKTGHH